MVAQLDEEMICGGVSGGDHNGQAAQDIVTELRSGVGTWPATIGTHIVRVTERECHRESEQESVSKRVSEREGESAKERVSERECQRE